MSELKVKKKTGSFEEPNLITHFSFDTPSETTESFSGSGDFDTSIVESLVEIGENETASANQTRDDLVKNLTSVGDEIEKSVTAGNQEQTLALLTDFRHVWFQLVNKSSGWYGVEPQDLRIYAAKILFLAKYAFKLSHSFVNRKIKL